MPAPEAAYAEVERLVKRFKALPTAERRSYNEDATRQAFILPLFRALEWNIDNAAEVSPEEKVSRGWVDYSFRLGGIPRFFLETKKIAEDLTDPRWVKQAMDYAWSKSVTWALLSCAFCAACSKAARGTSSWSNTTWRSATTGCAACTSSGERRVFARGMPKIELRFV